MKKKFVIALIVIVLIIVGALSFVVYNLGSLATQFKPELEKAASNALGSNVTLGKLDASIFPQARVQVDELKIASKRHSSESLSLKNVNLQVRLLPLFSKRLEITALSLDSPALTFIKDRNGVYLEGLQAHGEKVEKSEGKTEQTTSSAPTDKTQKASNSALGLNLEKFEIRNGALTFKDLEAKKVYDLTALSVEAGIALQSSTIKVQAFKASATALKNIPVALQANDIVYTMEDGVLSLPNLSMSVLGNVLKLAGEMKSKEGAGTLTLVADSFETAKLQALSEFAPVLKTLNPRGIFKTNLHTTFSTANEKKQVSYQATGALELVSMALQAAGFEISDVGGKISVHANTARQQAESDAINLKINGQPVKIALSTTIEDQGVKASKVALEGFSGKVTGNGTLALTTEKDFTSDVHVQSLDIAQALVALKPGTEPKFTGTLHELTTHLSGSLGSNVMQTLHGDGAIDLRNGVLKGVNVAGAALKAVKDLPFLADALYGSVPPEQRSQVDSPDTAIQSLTAHFRINDGALATPDLKLVSSIFELQAEGKVGFDASVDLNATIIFEANFSQGLAKRTKEIGRLLDSSGRLVIPLSLSGTAPKIIVLPNLKKLAELGAQKVLEEGASKLLDKFIGGKKGGGAGGSGGKKGLGGFLGF